MKPSKHLILSKLSFVLMISFLAMILSAAVFAAPTVQPLKGKTCVKLDAEFAAALAGFNISLGIIKPAHMHRCKAKVCFPICGGGTDLGSLNGEIFHTGGLSLTQGETSAELTSFIIDTTDFTAPVLTGLVAVNGDLVARLPLFNLDLRDAEAKQVCKMFSIRNVALTLTQEAAEALNGAFEEAELQGGVPIGVAKVYAFYYRRCDSGCRK